MNWLMCGESVKMELEKKTTEQICDNTDLESKDWISVQSLIYWCNNRPFCRVRKMLKKIIVQ
jgi:hypothetical protein